MDATAAPRERLTQAAAELIHQHGFARTTLAEIAEAAEIAAGSVYYYFRSKDDIAAAIVAKRVADIEQLLRTRDALPEPRARLESLVQVWVDDRDIDALYGCPVGSLCYELAKGQGALSVHAARPIRLLLDWCEAQFRALGPARAAPARALHLVAALQGISLLANSLGETAVITREAKYLKAWLREC
jgi:TetR/AcrR family transcriptional repressor of nem operon